MPSYVLSQADVDLLREIVRDWNASVENTQGRFNPGLDPLEQQAPETYVALTPQYGIAGFEYTIDTGTGTGTGTGSGDTVPYEDCIIYKLLPDKTLVSTRTTKRVHNLSTSDIEGDTYIVVTRDKFGYWWATGLAGEANTGTGTAEETTGTGTGTDFCEGTIFTDSRTRYVTDCIDGILYRTSYTQTITWEYVEGCISVDEGPEVEGATEEIGCCDCPDTTGTGSGEDETVITDCCDGAEIPTRLRVDITGPCAGAGSYVIELLTYSPGVETIWADTTGGNLCPEIAASSATNYIVLRCEFGDAWGLFINDALFVPGLDSIVCSPFEMYWSGNATSAGCACGATSIHIYPA